MQCAAIMASQGAKARPADYMIPEWEPPAPPQTEKQQRQAAELTHKALDHKRKKDAI